MVGFTFKSNFIGPITSSEKQQTIRRPRKHRPRVGQDLSFFTGSRYQPKRLGSARIIAVRDVRLDFEAGAITLDDAEVLQGTEALDAFAIRDGFNTAFLGSERPFGPWEYMARWWRMTHPDQPVFLGLMVDWGETFRAVEP